MPAADAGAARVRARAGAARYDASTRVERLSPQIEDIVDFVGDVVDKGFGYATDEGVWFDVGRLGTARRRRGCHVGTF